VDARFGFGLTVGVVNFLIERYKVERVEEQTKCISENLCQT